MPIFEFRCDNCHKEFEEICKNVDIHPQCPYCGSAATQKLMSAFSCARKTLGSDFESYSPPSSGSGCAGCSGGNCSSCGR